MDIPELLSYTTNHEWVRQETDDMLAIGITDFAQDNLGELVFVGMPAVSRQVTAEESYAVVESVKAASDICAPVAREIIANNAASTDTPNRVNRDPYGVWLFKLRRSSQNRSEQTIRCRLQRIYLDPVKEAP